MNCIGIIGAGMIAHVHAEAAGAVGTNVVAVCDPRIEKANLFSEKYSCDLMNSVDELLERTDIEGVVIAVPNDQHASLAIRALQAGKHVLLEKPMAMSVAECESILEARDQSGKILQLGFVCRYSPAAVQAKLCIEQGLIGEVCQIQATLLRQRGIPGLGGWFTTKERSGGGCLIDIGVHLIDVSMHITGLHAPVCASGICQQLFSIDSYSYDEMWSSPIENGIFDVEDRVLAMVRDISGTVFTYNVSWATHLQEGALNDGLVIEGTKGSLTIDLWTDTIQHGTSENGKSVTHEINVEVTEPWDDAFQGEHRAFARAMRTGSVEHTAGTGEDGLLVQRVVDAIYESSSQQQEVKI